jgi:hypothetical protein
MGFRCTAYTSPICGPSLPADFCKRWGATQLDESGPVISEWHVKNLDAFASDLQSVLLARGHWEHTSSDVVVLFLHDCGDMVRCQIGPDAIQYTEPVIWTKTDSYFGSASECSSYDSAENASDFARRGYDESEHLRQTLVSQAEALRMVSVKDVSELDDLRPIDAYHKALNDAADRLVKALTP